MRLNLEERWVEGDEGRQDEGSYMMPADFDKYADNYEKFVNSSLRPFGERDDYFNLYKLNCLKRWAYDPDREIKILDFGCGIGKLSELLAQAYPKSTVYGYDVSSKSIVSARKKQRRLQNLAFGSRLSEEETYDLIVASNVFHHIKRKDRRETLFRLKDLLKLDGILAIIEHNPFNPLTVHTVKSCPIDADADLISMERLIRLARGCGLEVRVKRYIVFFPKLLKTLRNLESYLGFLPLGAQYFAIFGRVLKQDHEL